MPDSSTASPAPNSAPVSLSGRHPDGWQLDHSYAALPSVLHQTVAPTPVRAPHLVVFNRPLAAALGLHPDACLAPSAAALFAGNQLPPGAAPLAQAYAGHQYGHFTTLGDGRAILLGEQLTPQGERFDIQLKGAGPTPYSRRGDGRAALGPMLREYLISEAMHALGIPTTRSLAVVATGDDVWRDDPLPGAVLTRVAASHIRVGTFQWAAAQRDRATLVALTRYTQKRHYPETAHAEHPALAFLEAVIERQARLIAQWMLVGFVHGVMNTDNMAISGETIDYGPCAFLDTYDPDTVFSSIDRHGRYAYANQPRIAQWNLARFAETLLPLLDPDEARAIEVATNAVRGFSARYEHHRLAGLRRKLGLINDEPDDLALTDDLLAWMHGTRRDFTLMFAALAVDAGQTFLTDPTFHAWHGRWQNRLTRQPLSLADATQLRRAHCPAVIPRNHLVEAALIAAQNGDLRPLEDLLHAVTNPYDHTHVPPAHRETPPARTPDNPYRTFCGT